MNAAAAGDRYGQHRAGSRHVRRQVVTPASARPRRGPRQAEGRFPVAATRTAPLAVLAAILPLNLDAQDPRQIALLRGQIGVEPEPGSLLAAPARLTIAGLPLEDALARLSERSGVQIAFSRTLLPAVHGVDCDCAALSLARTLDRLLAGTDLGYVEVGSQVVVVPRAEGEAPRTDVELRRGSRTVATLTGVVRDDTSLEPIAFAEVAVSPTVAAGATRHTA